MLKLKCKSFSKSPPAERGDTGGVSMLISLYNFMLTFIPYKPNLKLKAKKIVIIKQRERETKT